MGTILTNHGVLITRLGALVEGKTCPPEVASQGHKILHNPGSLTEDLVNPWLALNVVLGTILQKIVHMVIVFSVRQALIALTIV
jgi:hypothetical protein